MQRLLYRSGFTKSIGIDVMSIERPKLTDDIAKSAAVEFITKNADDLGIHSDIDDHANDLVKHFRGNRCGYELARTLEKSCHWMPNAEMVEALEGFGYYVDKAYEAVQQKWVDDNNIQPPIPVGSRVVYRGRAGVIDQVYEYMPAYYAIKEDDCTDSSRRALAKFEDVEIES